MKRSAKEWSTKVPKNEGLYWCHLFHGKWREWLIVPCSVMWIQKNEFVVDVFKFGTYTRHDKKEIYFGQKITVPVFDRNKK